MAATLLQNLPLVIISLVTCILPVFALGPTPTFLPLVGLVAVLRVWTELILPRPHAKCRLGALTASVTLGTSIAYGAEGLTALSSMAGSLVALVVLSSVFSGITILPFLVASKLDGYQNPFVFPAIWATVWSVVSGFNPVGRLGAWSPLLGLGGYSWTRPYLGAVGLDWILAAWAEIVGAIFIVFFWGGNSSEEPLEDTSSHNEEGQSNPIQQPEGPLEDTSSHNEEDQSDPVQQPNQSRQDQRPSLLVPILFAIVCAASIPSFSTDVLPLPISSDDTVPLGLACALPTITSEEQPIHSYLNETLRLAPLARLVLWPEGAVAFDSLRDRENKLEEVQKAAARNGIFIGVSFTEPAPESMNTHDARRKMRNGMVLVTATGSVYEYYKRNLVPVVEGFSQIPGSEAPSLTNITIPGTTRNRKHKRELPVTTSICLDFAHPFPATESKPAVILAPARTWDLHVGRAMYEQAKARADEVGAILLWCDGGEGGLSGVVGKGHYSLRRGEGSWAEMVGVQWPFPGDPHSRSWYHAHGSLGALCLAWGLPLLAKLVNRLPSGVVRSVEERRARGAPIGNLIDFLA